MQEQNLDLQMDALRKHGCDEVFSEKLSGGNQERPELIKCLSVLKSGDSLCVWKLDRLGRSLPHLVSIIEDLKNRKIEFVSLTENLNTSTPTGKLTFYVFAALAEFVRDTIKERTMAGLAAAKARGRVGGRPHKLKDKSLEMVLNLAKDPNNKPEEICRMAKISMATFYRYKQRSIET